MAAEVTVQLVSGQAPTPTRLARGSMEAEGKSETVCLQPVADPDAPPPHKFVLIIRIVNYSLNNLQKILYVTKLYSQLVATEPTSNL